MRLRQSVVTGIFILGFLAFLGAACRLLYTAPTVGMSVSWDESRHRHRVTSTLPACPLRPGDLILRVGDLDADFLLLLTDNIHIRDRKELFDWFRAKSALFATLRSPRVPFLIERDGWRLEIPVTPRPAGFGFLARLEILHVLAGIVFFLIGTIVFHKQRGSEQGVVFFALCMWLTLVFVSNATSLMSETGIEPAFFRWVNIGNIVALLMGNATLLHFSLLLPRKRAFLQRFRALPPIFHAVNLALGASLRIPAVNFALALYGPLAVAAIVHAWISYRRPLERQQMKWVGAGFAFGLAPWICINAIPMLITGERLMKDTLPAAFVVCIPLSMAFAIQKYKLMDIDAFLEGTFVTLTTVALLSIADVALMGFMTTHFGDTLAMGPAARGFVAIALVVSFYAAVRDRVRRLLTRVFRKERPREADILATFADRTAGLPPEAIVQVLEATIREVFRPQKILAMEISAASGETFGYFGGVTEPVNLWEGPAPVPIPAEDLLVALPVGRRAEVHHLLFLGALPGGRLYSRPDRTILKALLTQARTTYENALLHRENLRQHEARLQEERNHAREKEKILKELHDGIGGITTSISLLADVAGSRETLAEVKASLATIASLSRESLSEIRSFMQSLDPKEATWEALVGELRYSGGTLIRSHGMAFDMRTEGEPPGEEPGSLLFLNAFRIFKEALVNVVKHSGARSVRVDLSLASDLFSIVIEDDGAGLRGGGRGPAGRGMANMRTRAREVGGTVEVTSGSGTRVEFRVPLPAKYPDRGMESGEED